MAHVCVHGTCTVNKISVLQLLVFTQDTGVLVLCSIRAIKRGCVWYESGLAEQCSLQL